MQMQHEQEDVQNAFCFRPPLFQKVAVRPTGDLDRPRTISALTFGAHSPPESNTDEPSLACGSETEKFCRNRGRQLQEGDTHDADLPSQSGPLGNCTTQISNPAVDARRFN